MDKYSQGSLQDKYKKKEVNREQEKIKNVLAPEFISPQEAARRKRSLQVMREQDESHQRVDYSYMDMYEKEVEKQKMTYAAF